MVRLLEDSGSESDGGGVTIPNDDFKVNQEYAKRFDYNKKQEELRRLEDKLGKKRKRPGDDDDESDSDDSTSEEEDEGELATEALDAEILATLKAIKSKDPRVYDASAKFYTQLDNADEAAPAETDKSKPMYLRDYHRQNLMNGLSGGVDEVEDTPMTYEQEQADLKASIVKEIHNAAASDDEKDDQDSGSETEFLKAKSKPKRDSKRSAPQLDVETADKDPETFLSNFMSSRAWAENSKQQQPFESDDDEEDRKAEEWEEAYNFRFEDPQKSNEKLMSHARDVAAKSSVRRDEKSARQKKRDLEKEKKDAAKQELQDDRARLKKLRMEELEEKVRRIKRAAGMSSNTLDEKDWKLVLDNDWDDDKWDEEMQRQFGDDYYAADDMISDQDDEAAEGGKRSKKARKPKWDDDIDIKDLVPDFDEEEEAEFSLSEADAEADADKPKKKSSKEIKQERADQKRAARLERQKIEQIVDDQVKLEAPFLSNSKGSAGFRYRETSPTTYGLTARDILMADDSQLNEFAGLKKLATFRDPEKKRKDQKHLGKKARLRQWRKDTFGDEAGPKDEDFIKATAAAEAAAGENGADDEDGGVDIREGEKKKRRRSKKKKVSMES